MYGLSRRRIQTIHTYTLLEHTLYTYEIFIDQHLKECMQDIHLSNVCMSICMY